MNEIELTPAGRQPKFVLSRRDTLRAIGMTALGAGLGVMGSVDVAHAAADEPWLGFIMGRNGMVFDIAWGSRDENAAVIQWPLNGGANQIFRFDDLGGGRYRIVATHSGKVLTVGGSPDANGASLVQATWNAGSNQQFVEPNYGWQPTPLLRVIHNRRAKSLQAAGLSGAAGARIVQWEENYREPGQQWRWKASAMRAVHSGLVAHAPPQLGSQLSQAPFGQRGGGLASLLFRIEGIAGGGNGFYRIVTGNRVLSVPGGGLHNGAPIVTERWTGTSNQLWKIEPVRGSTSYYRVVNAHSNKVMDVSGSSLAQGARIHQWERADVTNQVWRL